MRASWLWLSIIPLMYLPNFKPIDTGFGVLETSDFIVIPLFTIVLLIPKKTLNNVNAKSVVIPGIGFLIWATLGTFMISLNFDYSNSEPVIAFSLLKIFKFALYSITPLAIAKRLVNDRVREDFHWVLLAAGIVFGGGIWYTSMMTPATSIGVKEKFILFKALNLLSVGMAILIVYLSGLLLTGYGKTGWRLACKFSIVTLLGGISYSEGRGGILACVIGLIYMMYSRGVLRVRSLIWGFVAVASLVAIYFLNPEFKYEVDRTLFPKVEAEQVNGLIIDDGYRLLEWQHSAKKLGDSLIFGTGFHHRGGLSGLNRTGSHNFWLQIFLETGLVGGTLILLIFIQMWKQAASKKFRNSRYALAVRSALVTAFIGGLGGEYFYGSVGLFSLLLIYAPLGSLSPTSKVESLEIYVSEEKEDEKTPKTA